MISANENQQESSYPSSAAESTIAANGSNVEDDSSPFQVAISPIDCETQPNIEIPVKEINGSVSQPDFELPEEGIAEDETQTNEELSASLQDLNNCEATDQSTEQLCTPSISQLNVFVEDSKELHTDLSANHKEDAANLAAEMQTDLGKISTHQTADSPTQLPLSSATLYAHVPKVSSEEQILLDVIDANAFEEIDEEVFFRKPQ